MILDRRSADGSVVGPRTDWGTEAADLFLCFSLINKDDSGKSSLLDILPTSLETVLTLSCSNTRFVRAAELKPGYTSILFCSTFHIFCNKYLPDTEEKDCSAYLGNIEEHQQRRHELLYQKFKRWTIQASFGIT